MKKIFLIALAASLMSVVSCGGGSDAKADEKGEAAQTEATAQSDFVDVDNGEFSFSHPKALKATLTTSRVINMKTDDKKASLDMTLGKLGPAVEELNHYATVNEDKKKNAGEEVDKPIVEGNVLKIRSVKDGVITQFFVIAHDGKRSITGELKYDQSLAGEYDAYLDPIIKSYKFK